jgi:hypothetical protein
MMEPHARSERQAGEPAPADDALDILVPSQVFEGTGTDGHAHTLGDDLAMQLVAAVDSLVVSAGGTDSGAAAQLAARSCNGQQCAGSVRPQYALGALHSGCQLIGMG